MTGRNLSGILVGAAFACLAVSACLTVNTPAQQPTPTKDVGQMVEAALTRAAEPTDTPTPEITRSPVIDQAEPTSNPTPTLDPLHSGPSIAELVKMVRPSLARIVTTSGNGSGFVYDARGWVVTNAHVIDCCQRVSVIIENQRYDGQVVGMDQHADIAVVRIDGAGRFHPASFGDANKTTIGDEVIALGFPLSLGRELTATKGIISSKRSIRSHDYLQHDAPINPGNSGGPLINFDGLVVGMNTLKRGDAEGIGFAISASEIEHRLSRLSGTPYAADPTPLHPTSTPIPYYIPTPTRHVPPTHRPTPTPYHIPTSTPPSQQIRTGYQQFDLGTSHGCAIKADNSIVCWGSNKYGQASPPSGQFKEVNVGTSHSCAIKMDNTVMCWGSNESLSATLQSGKVITGSYIGQANPPAGLKFQHIEASRWQTCGILMNGYLECWGGDTEITIDGKSQLDQSKPKIDIPRGVFSQVDLGYRKHCAVQPDGSVSCWGFYPKPVPVGKYKQLSMGFWHNCGVLTTGQVNCWTNTNPEDFAISNPPSGTFIQVSAGSGYTCGIRTDWNVICWINAGTGTTYGANDTDYGQATPPPGQFVYVVASTRTSCGLKVDGTIECWGSNKSGQAAPPSPW